MKKEVRLKFGAEDIIVSFGEMARQANGSVVVKMGETSVLVSAVMAEESREGIDFLPLMVEYRERAYAGGKIPGGFFKREGRPTEKETLTARLIDRPLRPLFPEGLRNEVQITAVVLSSDGKYDPDILSVIGASAALSISDIPWDGPVGCVRVAMVDNSLILNPSYQQLEKANLNLVVVGFKDRIIMLEGESKEITEEEFSQAVAFAHQNIVASINMQQELASLCKNEKQNVKLDVLDEKIYSEIKNYSSKIIDKIILVKDKKERSSKMSQLKNDLLKKYEETCRAVDINEALYKIQKDSVRRYLLENKKRIDGRGFEDIREIDCAVSVLPRTHGSALFTRGQTQSLAVTTLGTSSDEQTVESYEGEMSKKFMLHYNFPYFSVGETGPMRGPGRREIGHGALAEKALSAVMPKEGEFPYTVRIVSDILESNGSSSMATVCSGSLAMMDAGVPLGSSVAGVALGLFQENDKDFILTDIAGLEDHFGDMDFKVAGTRKGITAVQMDLKINGITSKLIVDILSQAKTARLKILDIMDRVISKPRSAVSGYAPRLVSFKLESGKVAILIGPGGKTIRKIISETGAKFDIDDDGVVNISADNDEQLQHALAKVEELIKDIEVGALYDGRIVKIVNFGAFCEIAPSKEGLIHVSEISDKRIPSVEDVLKVGDRVRVKVLGIDDAGKIKLSMKQVS